MVQPYLIDFMTYDRNEFTQTNNIGSLSLANDFKNCKIDFGLQEEQHFCVDFFHFVVIEELVNKTCFKGKQIENRTVIRKAEKWYKTLFLFCYT